VALGGSVAEGVWPQNVATVEAFLAVSTQWRTGVRPAGFGSATLWIGLDYAGVRAGLEVAGIAGTPDLWGGLTIMEHEAARALNEMAGR
jgi:hypothetical protein